MLANMRLTAGYGMLRFNEDDQLGKYSDSEAEIRYDFRVGRNEIDMRHVQDHCCFDWEPADEYARSIVFDALFKNSSVVQSTAPLQSAIKLP